MDQEQIWLEEALEGNQDAFGKLVEIYQERVYNLAYRMLGDPYEAEDAAMECFVRAYRKLHQYDPQRKFATWLLSITSNHCIDQIRRRKMFFFSMEDEKLPYGTLASQQPSPERRVLDAERDAEVQAMLGTLSGKYRAAVILHYWYDMTYEEIAETTGESVGAIKSRLFRARQTLARQMQLVEHSVLVPA